MSAYISTRVYLCEAEAGPCFKVWVFWTRLAIGCVAVVVVVVVAVVVAVAVAVAVTVAVAVIVAVAVVVAVAVGVVVAIVVAVVWNPMQFYLILHTVGISGRRIIKVERTHKIKLA